MVEKTIASGPVIISEGKLLVTKDSKDNFYKIPGGRVKGDEKFEETCLRRLTEETGFSCKILKKLSTLFLDKNPQTGEPAEIELHHYLGELSREDLNYASFEHDGHGVNWLDIEEIKQGKHDVAPNIKFLVEKGEIK